MLLRHFRLMASTQARHLPAITRDIHSAELSRSVPRGGAMDPFGPDWPASEPLATTQSPPLKDTRSSQTSSPSPSTGPGTIHAASGATVGSKEVLRGGMSHVLNLPSVPTVGPQAPSKHVKENVSAEPKANVVLDPPIVHPLKTYSYKNCKPSPSCIYVRDEEEADKLVGSLSGAVGFDIEWKVVFCKGSKMRPAATVQLSDRKTILVIQVSAMKAFPKKLKELLENDLVAKIGVNILNDGKKLARDYGVRPKALVELGGLAQQADTHYVERYFRATEVLQKPSCTVTETEIRAQKPGAKINLATITVMYTGCALPKGPVRISDWETQPLSETQLDYAANDAHSALVIYDRLISMAKARGVTLVPAKYTSGVGLDYGLSDTKPRVGPLTNTAPIFQAPALTSKASSSSTAPSSTSTSGGSGSESSASSTATAPRCPSASSIVIRPKDVAASEARFKPVFPISHALVSDSDVEILEYRHVVTRKVLSTSASKGALQTASNGSVSRDRTGPRFKPSYNNFPRPTPESANVPAGHKARPLATLKGESRSNPTSSNRPPERSPRFKPSYNTTVPRPVSPVKHSTLADQSTASGPSSVDTSPPNQAYQPSYQRTQHIRAYNLWHVRQLPLAEICGILRSRDNPLKTSTVISYVVTAIQTDPRLRFSRERLRALLASEPKSWLFYRDWFRTLNVARYVNMDTGVEPKESKHEHTTTN